MNKLLCSAAFLAAFASSVSAATISVSPGDLALLGEGTTFTADETVSAGTTRPGSQRDNRRFNHAYFFNAGISDIDFSAMTKVGKNGRSAIQNLTFIWTDKTTKEVVSRLKVTNSKGKLVGSGMSPLALLEGHDYKLKVKGQTGRKSGRYGFDVVSDGVPTAVPVPPAMLLLGSAMFGLVLLGRRKQSKSA